jgi:acetone carboxylase gamma subunit
VTLGPARENYTYSSLLRERPLEEANPNIRPPAIYTDREVVFREYVCPESGRLLQTEIVVDGAAPLWDLRPADTDRTPTTTAEEH